MLARLEDLFDEVLAEIASSLGQSVLFTLIMNTCITHADDSNVPDVVVGV